VSPQCSQGKGARPRPPPDESLVEFAKMLRESDTDRGDEGMELLSSLEDITSAPIPLFTTESEKYKERKG
jgi:hypothetical protein